MCGIAGVYGRFPFDSRRSALKKMAGSLAHRGPDGSRIFEDELIGLVHTRLSIIDLSEAGNQPFFNEDRTLALVCNGELYNYQALRKKLLEKGHVFSSDSDSEVILHLYEEHHQHPERMLNELTGMFAFALWDSKKELLFIARDRVGIKPLYYYRKGDSFVFASEVKPITDCSLVNVTPDPTSMYEYFLTGSVPGPNTFFNEVKSLEPGYYAIVRDSRMNITQYWDVPLTDGSKWKKEQDVLVATDELMQQVVSDHLIADVPVGSFLSAGVDSSLITAWAVKASPGIHTFTASFPGEDEDEGTLATATARRLGTTHHSYEVTSGFFDDFEYQFEYIDQPFAITSALSLGSISQLAGMHVKVVLSGDGGDELFGGYYRHKPPVLPDFLRHVPASMHDTVLKIGAKVTGRASLTKVRENLKVHPAQVFFDRMIAVAPEMALSCIAPDVRRNVDEQRYMNRLKQIFDRTAGADILSQTLYADVKTTLVDEMLTKCDRMTMRNGIEGRVPFLDHRVVEHAFSIPSAFKRNGDTGKVPLRKLLAQKLGQELAYREKTGFNSPLGRWLTSDEATRVYARTSLAATDKVPMINGAIAGQLSSELQNADRRTVFAMVCLAAYFRRAASV